MPEVRRARKHGKGMTTLATRKTLTRPARICESCQLEADTLYNSINGAYLCEDCANLEGEE